MPIEGDYIRAEGQGRTDGREADGHGSRGRNGAVSISHRPQTWRRSRESRADLEARVEDARSTFRWHLRRLMASDDVGRPLHPAAVGGVDDVQRPVTEAREQVQLRRPRRWTARLTASPSTPAVPAPPPMPKPLACIWHLWSVRSLNTLRQLRVELRLMTQMRSNLSHARRSPWFGISQRQILSAMHSGSYNNCSS